MDRLKELGTWIILVIAFYIFANGLIYICLNNGSMPNNNTNNNQIINETR